jgi:hypothetical protein
LSFLEVCGAMFSICGHAKMQLFLHNPGMVSLDTGTSVWYTKSELAHSDYYSFMTHVSSLKSASLTSSTSSIQFPWVWRTFRVTSRVVKVKALRRGLEFILYSRGDVRILSDVCGGHIRQPTKCLLTHRVCYV